ncbi:ATP-grasp domain-containing protein [Planosporangium thailandense]|uniref:ATP-grasp domain-containing protein n=1 Tax=Planosporangium thailandense TaxID=765197 RepID=A0ABX0Y120_9ACTN|nr:ATP-grasp domain-containing protein [Planosporangium thailandense]NJC71275.1 ATP-grasp domain-containing protein [Planosporangium thailandense]
MRRNRSPRRPPAVLLGAGVNLIEVTRALAVAGIPSAIAAPDQDAARLSRHTTVVATHNWSDPEAASGEDRLIQRLVSYARTQPGPPPLFFTSDEALLFVSRYRDALGAAYRFAIADPDTVETLADKARFAVLAERLGVRAPRTRILAPRPGAVPDDVSRLRFPLIVKPYRRDRGWHEVVATAKKALQVGDEQDLRTLWRPLAALGAPVVVQEAVPGPESRVESYHVYVDRDGRTAAEFVGQKIRTMPPEFGHTTALTITDTPDVLKQGRELVRVLGLRGVAKVDFKRAPDGELFVLEVNPRFHLWHHPGARAGVNIPALVYADLTGAPRPASGPARAGVRWVHPRDVSSAGADDVSIWRWIRWAGGCDAKAFWAWDDPLPLIAAVAARTPFRR